MMYNEGCPKLTYQLSVCLEVSLLVVRLYSPDRPHFHTVYHLFLCIPREKYTETTAEDLPWLDTLETL